MDKTGDYITEEKKIALEKELADLRGPKRREIIEILEYAKSLGDLSENAEYHNAREDQGKLEERIKELEKTTQKRKTYWMITNYGAVTECPISGKKTESRREWGNYFDSQESAEKARVEIQSILNKYNSL